MNNQTNFSNAFRKDKVVRVIFILFIAFMIMLLIGVVGYRHFFKMQWEDAVFNTSLTITNLGIGLHEKSREEKIFTGLFSILSGLFFISLVSAIVGYVFTLYLGNGSC